MQFQDIVERICAKSPFQRKKLTAYLSAQPESFRREADEFASRYGAFLAQRGISLDYVVDAYLKMCAYMMRCQVAFLRSGKYPVASAAEADQAVYQSEQEMLSYMIGLGMSQFLWSTHYRIFSAFKELLAERAATTRRYLEIGPGHGLLLEQALTTLDRLEDAVAIDLSPTSLELTRALTEWILPGERRLRYLLGDVMEADLGVGFDLITMGEVLEHVEQPLRLLRRLRDLLAPGGRLFVSTCANCPAPDHVYQFGGVAQIRTLLADAGFKVERDFPLPVENMSVDAAEAARVTINYCAVLS
jgi:2-polyprenyl-3-methyl-5-hydroxy-6-metoxy-1,4-benzoquinol methylase